MRDAASRTGTEKSCTQKTQKRNPFAGRLQRPTRTHSSHCGRESSTGLCEAIMRSSFVALVGLLGLGAEVEAFSTLAVAPKRDMKMRHMDSSVSRSSLFLSVPRSPSIISTCLLVNSAVYSANAIMYLSPLRNKVIKTLFGIAEQDFFSPTSGTLMYLGGLYLAIAINCLTAVLFSWRSAKEALIMMVFVHMFQCAIGIWRMLATRADGKATSLDELLGAGGGPATAAAILGGGSLAAILS